MHLHLRILSVVLSASVGAAGPVHAAETAPAVVPDKPALTMRVGGSPADAVFRAAQQKSGADFRAARTACRNGAAGAERTQCLKTARDRLKAQRLEAQAAHDAAKATR